MNELPIIGGTVTVLLGAIVGLFRWLVQNDLVLLRDQVDKQSARIASLEVLYDEQRREKHRLANDLAKAQILLGVIVDLAEKCTCGALEIVDDLLRRAVPDVNPEDT